jgi:hypothetical protein
MPERLHRLSISSRGAIAVKKVRTSILKKVGAIRQSASYR